VKLLFDTHTFLWWESQPEKLSSTVLDLCRNPDNTLLFSVANAWEIQVKTQLGKLRIQRPLGELLAEQEQTNKLQILPVELGHVLALQHLPDYHRDPFDRMLIAQALVEGAALMTRDQVIARYAISTIW
jgi:PIN domain nuclease of toxin-antitoxin system